MPGTLYIIATPIGNLGDITLRALTVLKSADFVLCEDTRVTQKLLKHYEITTPTLRYNEHESETEVSRIVNFLNQGKNLALVSDAGTPGISDPGGKLAEYICRYARDIKIVPIPGPSALIAAASISGFRMDKFVFLGFPPAKNKRKKFFSEVASAQYPVILYESPHRILKTLNDLLKIVPDRDLVVCRELTKKFETIYRGTASEVINMLPRNEIKGEFVITLVPGNYTNDSQP